MFTTLFAMAITDAYLAYKLEFRRCNHGDDTNAMNVFQFSGQLAHSLIFNEFLQQNAMLRQRDLNDDAVMAMQTPILVST